MATTKLDKHRQLWLSKYSVLALNTIYVEKNTLNMKICHFLHRY